MPKKASADQNERIVLASAFQTLLPIAAGCQAHTDGAWLAKQRSRYNDEGDALLRAMLTVFKQGSPLTGARHRVAPDDEGLEFDFAHLGHIYRAQASFDAEGGMTRLCIRSDHAHPRCLYLDGQAGQGKTDAAYLRLPQRSATAHSLYQLLQEEARLASKVEALLGESEQTLPLLLLNQPRAGTAGSGENDRDDEERGLDNAGLARYVIDMDRIYRKMEFPNASLPLVLEELERKSLEEKSKRDRARARRSYRQTRLEEDETEEEKQEQEEEQPELGEHCKEEEKEKAQPDRRQS